MQIEEIIEELRALNEEVPKPLRLPSVEELDQIETDLGITLNPDYRKFLLSAGDVVYGVLEPALAIPDHPAQYLVNIAREAWQDGLDQGLLPICEDNGDYYCLNASGEVEFWSHEGASDEKWPSLAAWISEVWIEES